MKYPECENEFLFLTNHKAFDSKLEYFKNLPNWDYNFLHKPYWKQELYFPNQTWSYQKKNIKEVYVLYYQGEVWDIFSTFERANEAARNLIIETYDDYDDVEILDILKVFNESRNHPCGCYDSFGEIIAKLDDIIISKYPVDPE